MADPSLTAAGSGICGIDVGGSGCRVLVMNLADRKRGESAETSRLSIGSDGIVLPDLIDRIENATRKAALQAGVTALSAVALGMTGALTLTAGSHQLHRLLHKRLGATVTVVASDAYTSLLGALGGGPGAIVAAGTGVVGFGTDFDDTWRRVDGWGHILGDEGGGTWIGTHGLRAALAAHDGRSDGSTILLKLLRSRFGSPEELTAQTYTRTDRAGFIASFVPDVLQAAHQSDPIAKSILHHAGQHLARTAVAAASAPIPPRISLIGGIFSAAPVLTEIVRNNLQELRPDLQLLPATGTSLDGALHLAHQTMTKVNPAIHDTLFVSHQRHH